MAVTEHSPTPAASGAPAGPRPRTLNDVPGWFWDFDRFLFEWLLTYQEQAGQVGDLLELGCFQGKSAIVIGRHQRPGEAFTVCDLFGSAAPDEANGGEVADWYQGLTREAFEANYLAFHDRLPEVVAGPTSLLADGRLRAGGCRFAHIDASHLYDHVAADIALVERALAPAGIVALDDYRYERTPGVAAAVWEAVLTRGLRPIVLSANKLYGTWGDPAPAREELLAGLAHYRGLVFDQQSVAGQTMLRIEVHQIPPLNPPRSRHYYSDIEAFRAKIDELKRMNTDGAAVDELAEQAAAEVARRAADEVAGRP